MLELEGAVIANGEFAVDADLKIAPGTRVAVIGPSGAGKSTLLAGIAGFAPLSAGQVRWNDARIDGLAPGARPLSMVFQEGNLFPHLNVAQNVGMGLRPDLHLSQAEQLRVTAALERVGLEEMGKRRPSALSGGQQSRVALARVLLRNRPVLLLDEPFAALGPALRHEMLDLVADIAAEESLTLLMVTHDPRDARRIASQTILVAEGVAHPPRATDALLDDPPEVLRAYLGAE
ncbi:MAG: ATP-binding cassette domain-containing protein [Celeribacter sp.]|jgi:thiamine transport system ATP-binding protein